MGRRSYFVAFYIVKIKEFGSSAFCIIDQQYTFPIGYGIYIVQICQFINIVIPMKNYNSASS